MQIDDLSENTIRALKAWLEKVEYVVRQICTPPTYLASVGWHG